MTHSATVSMPGLSGRGLTVMENQLPYERNRFSHRLLLEQAFCPTNRSAGNRQVYCERSFLTFVIYGEVAALHWIFVVLRLVFWMRFMSVDSARGLFRRPARSLRLPGLLFSYSTQGTCLTLFWWLPMPDYLPRWWLC